MNIRHLAATSLGPHYEGASMWLYDTRNNYNYLVAAVTRLCREVPEFTAGPDFDVFVDDFIKFYDLKGPIPICSLESYIMNHPSYTSKKKLSLLKLAKDTENASFEDLWNGTTADSFLKWETYTEEKKPRMINPRPDFYKVRVAHIHHCVDKFLYDKLASFLVKGLTTTQRTELLVKLFSQRENITTSDFSSQECSIKYALMLIECKLYQGILKGCIDDELLNLIITTKLSHQRLSGSGLKLLLDIMRDSGDPDTASMNAFQNIISTSYTYKTQLYPEMSNFEFFAEKGNSYEILCEGDDGIHCSTRGKIDASTYTSLGYIAKILHHDTYAEASFCGQVLSSQNTLLSDPAKFLLKLGWAQMKYHNASHKTKSKLLVAKAYSALYLYPGCPVIHPIASTIVMRHLSLIDESLKRYQFDDPYKIAQITFSQSEAIRLCQITIDPRDRLDFERIYDLSAEEQMSLEREPMIGPWSSGCLNRILKPEYFENFIDCARRAPISYTETAEHDFA